MDEGDDTNRGDEPTVLTDLVGVDEETASELRWAGYRTPDDIRTASREDLAEVDGVSTPLAARLKVEVGDSDGSDDDSGATAGAGADGTTPSGAIGRVSVFGLGWYHYALILVLMMIPLLEGSISPSDLPVAFVVYFVLVFAVTKLVRRTPSPHQTPEEQRETADEQPKIGGTVATDRQLRAGGADAIASEASDQAVHFEEVISLAAGAKMNLGENGPAMILGGYLVFFVLPAFAGLVWALFRFESVLYVLAFNVVVWLIGLVLLRSSRMRARVQVTDDGVAVKWIRGGPLSGDSGVFVPFEEITGVQYSEPTGENIHVTYGDYRNTLHSMWEADGFVVRGTDEHHPRTFLVQTGQSRGINTNYVGGVRIERADSPLVYVGSVRPREFAAAIVEHAPAVERIEQL